MGTAMIRTTLNDLLCSADVEQTMRERIDEIAALLPETIPMFGFEQHNPHHDKTVWDHTVAVVANAPVERVLRWTALLHDIGKPHCFSVDAQGIGHFYGHASRSAVIAEEILQRLQFDAAVRERIVLLVKNHDTPLPVDDKGTKRLINRLGVEVALQLVDIHRADTAGLHPDYAYRYAEFDEVQARIERIAAELGRFSVKDLAIDGNDLVAMGLKGKQIGHTLQAALEAVMAETIPNEHASLLDYVRSRVR